MSVTFVLGRAGTGKTRHCLEAVRSALACADDPTRLILLVPEQASFQMERALALGAPRGGYTRAEVLSFTRLAWRVLQQTGPEPRMLSATARRLVLRKIAGEIGAEITLLRRLRAAEGLYAELDRLIEELLHEDVTPGALLAAAAQLSDAGGRARVTDVVRVYAAYLDWLGDDRRDPAQLQTLVRQRLTRLEWLPQASVWVDGFAGFTGQELATLVELARRAHRVTITLLVDPASPAVRNRLQAPDPLGLFQRIESTYQRLVGMLQAAGVELTPPVALQPAPAPRFAQSLQLARLEAALAEPIRPSADSALAQHVRIRACATHRDELRAAASWIRAAVADRDGSLSFRDFAVIARDLGSFADLVAEVFAEYEIPYFLDRRRPLSAHPLSRLLPALLDVVLTDFGVDATVCLLRTRLLPLTRDEAEQLENLLVRGQFAGQVAWQAATWVLESVRQPMAAFAPQRHALVAVLEPLCDLAAHSGTPTGGIWARTLSGVVEQLQVRRRAEEWLRESRQTRAWEAAELHRQAWEALGAALRDLHEVLGDTPLAGEAVRNILSGALSEINIGLAPPTVDQVLVSSIERSRHPDIQHAWVFALNEGIFPARPREDRLLTAEHRAGLRAGGLPALAPHREDILAERLLAYIAFTRPSTTLTISYATVSDDGQDCLPSPLLDALLQRLPQLTVERHSPEAPPTCVAELARGYLRAREHLRPRYERLCAEMQENPALSGPLDFALRGLRYSNAPEPLGSFRRLVVGGADIAWRASPSEVETAIQCPFQHYARFGLCLDAQRRPQPLRWDLGSIAHEVLADVTRRAARSTGGVRGLTDRDWERLLAAAWTAYWQRQPADQPQRRPDLAFLGGLLGNFIRDLVHVHAARWRRGDFTPHACEQRFDPGGGIAALHSLALTLPDDQRIHLYGQVDRIDVCEAAGRRLVLVYDYKSTAGASLKNARFLTGPRLQIWLYLLAVQRSGGEAWQPAGVFLAPLYPNLKALTTQHTQTSDGDIQRMHMYLPRGLVTEEAARRLDRELGSEPSPVAQLRLKKTDGAFYANADTLPDAMVSAYLELAQQTLFHAAEGICAGRIDVAPLVENRTLACRLCDYAAVCRFDRAYNQPRAAETALPTLPSEDSA